MKWFDTTVMEEVSDDVWILRTSGFLSPAGKFRPNVVSVIIRHQDEVIMTDPGLRLFIRGKIREIKRRNLTVSGILLTHGHPDHVGGVKEILKSFPGCQVFVGYHEQDDLLHPREFFEREMRAVGPHRRAYLGPLDRLYSRARKIFNSVFGLFTRVYYGYQKVDGFETLLEGQIIQFGRHQLEVVELPGHQPGEIGFWLAERRILIAGDLIRHWEEEKDRLASFFLPRGDVFQAILSLKKIISLKPEMIIPAHGFPLRGEVFIRQRLELMIETLEKIIEEVKTLSRGKPSLSASQIAGKINLPAGTYRTERLNIVISILRQLSCSQ